MRKLSYLVGAFVVALITVFAIVRIRAQEPPSQAEGSLPPGALSESSLTQMLTDMGYEPKKLKQGQVVIIKEGGWTYNVQLVLSPNREKLGLNANVGSVEEPGAVTAAQWMSVLATNTDIAPSFFYYNKANHTLYIHRALDNRTMSSAFLKRQITAFTANIHDTADVWKFTK